MRNPYELIKSRYVTEKSTVLEQLHGCESNVCVARCTSPKFVFIVDRKATKPEIAKALEMIYKEQKIKVTSVNTSIAKPKPKKRGKGKKGATASFKKAIVTLEAGDTIDNV